ncbi:MAG: peptide chain release factor N(5)-glutamine methyltransferase [Planctomycetota bacterium]
MARTTQNTWTTRRLLEWIYGAFEQKGLDDPRLSADVLLSRVLGCDRMKLYTDADRPASPIELATLRDLVHRALDHEPVQYLTGEAWFFGLRLRVDQRVLIPRPATETIVEQVLHHCKSRPGFGGKTGEGCLIADIGTGSGAIALALASNLSGARVVATDLSAEALDVASENAELLGLNDRIEFVPGDLLDALTDHPTAGQLGELDFLVSNPPYIPDSEWDAVAPNVRNHEPTMALRGGMDGLAVVRPLLAEGPRLVKPGGLVLVEVAASTAAAARTLPGQAGHDGATSVLNDLEQHPRVIRHEVV